MTGFRSLLRFELSRARRARTLSWFAIGFALASLAITLVGLSAGGAIEVQGFARTSMSLMQLVLWLVPLIALLLGSSVGAECLEMEMVMALPASRRQLLLARWTAWFLALGGAMLVGLGVAGAAIGLLAGGADAWRFLRLVAIAETVLAVHLALGLWIGVAARSRVRAIALGVLAWLVLVIVMDLAAIGLLAVLPRGHSAWGLSALLLIDPVDAARTLAISLLQADVVAGPMGAALRKVLGGYGVWLLATAMLAWIVVPLIGAGRRFARSDV